MYRHRFKISFKAILVILGLSLAIPGYGEEENLEEQLSESAPKLTLFLYSHVLVLYLDNYPKQTELIKRFIVDWAASMADFPADGETNAQIVQLKIKITHNDATHIKSSAETLRVLLEVPEYKSVGLVIHT